MIGTDRTNRPRPVILDGQEANAVTIRVERRGESPRCSYCLDDVTQGTTCESCGARYHDECAVVFGRCGILGCTQRFAADTSAVVLPRLGALARRLGQWHHDALLAGDAHVLVLQPCPWETTSDAAAARAVADLLGGDFMPYDGRVRLQSRFPEPLVRFGSLPPALEAAARLGAAKLPATTIPVRTLLRPLEPFLATTLRLSEGALEFQDGEGHTRSFARGAPRLVVIGREITHRTIGQTSRVQLGSGRGGYRTASRPSFARASQRSQEMVATLAGPDERPPVVIRRSKLRVEGPGLQGMTWAELKDELTRGATTEEVEGANADTLLSLISLGQGRAAPEIRSNAGALALIARMIRHEWERTLPPTSDGKKGAEAPPDAEPEPPDAAAPPRVVVRPRPRKR